LGARYLWKNTVVDLLIAYDIKICVGITPFLITLDCIQDKMSFGLLQI
jgi:hypothetical protein